MKTSRFNKRCVTIALFAAIAASACGQDGQPLASRTSPITEPDPYDPGSPGAAGDRYGLPSATRKLVDNRGNGYENLYGTRNFRSVLANRLYRGGANNSYNRYGSRSNTNP